MTRLLINENPLQVLPTLAVKIGLNEALILQQMHYWLNADHNKNYLQGRHWVYNSYDEWHKQFPFWSKETIKRTIYSLEKQKLVVSDKLSEEKFNHRKWYSIDYMELQRLDQENDRSGQFVTNGEGTYETPDQVKMTRSDGSHCSEHIKEQRLPTEITAETSSSRELEKEKIVNEMKNIWIEEIGEEETIELTEILISKILISYHTIFNSSLDNWRSYCRKIASSQFLMGEKKGTNFKAKFSWAIKTESYDRIQAGDFTLGDRNIRVRTVIFSLKEQDKLNKHINDSGKHPLWIAVCQEMLARGEGQAVKQWLLELDIAHYSSNNIYIHAPNRFIRDWVKKNLIDLIRASLKSIIGSEIQHISIDVYENNTFGAPLASEKEEERTSPPNCLSSSITYSTVKRSQSTGLTS